MEIVDSTKRLCCEEHVEKMETLDWMKSLQCQFWERLEMVLRGQNQLAKKVENLETWLAHFEWHGECDFCPPPHLGTTWKTLHPSCWRKSILFGVVYVLYVFWCLCPNRLWTMSLVPLNLYFLHLVQNFVNKPSQGKTTYFVISYMYSFFPTWI